MNLRNLARYLAAAAISLCTAHLLPGQAADTEITVEQNVAVTMRDGTTLRADIYRPKADGKYPVLLTRTPYNKSGNSGIGKKAAAAGYVLIAQDVRGRYSSDGDWYPFVNEQRDGYDTIEWAAALPYADGRVGMFGGSYVGATQMLAAIGHPPHLAGIDPYVTASNYHRNWTYQGGAFEQWFNQSWSASLAPDTLSREIKKDTNALLGVWKTPLTDFPLFNAPGGAIRVDTTQSIAPYYLDWLAHPNFDDYWKAISIEDHFADIQVPALHTAAWYDIFQGGSIRNFEGLQARAGNEKARAGQHLTVVIGGHAGAGRKIGEVDFGPNALFDDSKETIAWYDYLFKGVKNHYEKPVRIFVMGTNEWREENEWPLKRAQAAKYFLHAVKGANSLRGDGQLTTTAPKGSEAADQYTYDPANPVPTIGGPLCCDAVHLPPGPRDQRQAEGRDDVLVYTTSPFAKDTEVTGQILLDLYAKSSAVDTDFAAKLVDVWPNGFAQNLTEGILRARYRNSDEKPELLNPGELYKLQVDLWSTSNVFRKGHRLRLEISSSNFPRFDRNRNTGAIASTDRQSSIATNTILHDTEHPSVLTVPIVPDIP